MRTKVQSWGNSLAVRIPKSFAQEMGLEAGAAVEMHREGGGLVIEPAHTPTLDELLQDVTDANLHAALDTGPAQGREVW